MRVVAWLLPVIGALLLLSSFAHAFLGWPPIRGELEQNGVARELVGAIAVGWYFGSVAMAVFGMLVFLCWREMSHQESMGRAAAGLLSVTYLLFGVLAFLLRSFNPHFLIAFALPGLILGVPVVLSTWRRR